MNNDNLRNLCTNLAKAESEDEVIDILKAASFWDDPNI